MELERTLIAPEFEQADQSGTYVTWRETRPLLPSSHHAGARGGGAGPGQRHPWAGVAQCEDWSPPMSDTPYTPEDLDEAETSPEPAPQADGLEQAIEADTLGSE